MNNAPMNNNMVPNGPEKVKKNNTKKDLLVALAIVFGIFLGIFVLCFIMYKMFVPISWSRFNDKRIKYIEDTLKLDLDNVEPLHYRHARAQDHIADFDFKVDDYKSLMENDFHGGAIISHFEEDDKSGAKYVCWVEDTSDVYSKCFDVTFTKEDDGYRAHLYCYRDVGAKSKYYKETTSSQ